MKPTSINVNWTSGEIWAGPPGNRADRSWPIPEVNAMAVDALIAEALPSVKRAAEERTVGARRVASLTIDLLVEGLTQKSHV